MEKATVSLADLDMKKHCEDGHRFEYLDGDHKGTGIFFTVLGAHAEKIEKWSNSELNARRRQEAMQAKRGDDVDVRLIEDDIEFGVEFVALRIIAWEGITQPYTPENALKLCRSNPMVFAQVRAASEKIANFTKGK